jgi:hypothetical protein
MWGVVNVGCCECGVVNVGLYMCGCVSGILCIWGVVNLGLWIWGCICAVVNMGCCESGVLCIWGCEPGEVWMWGVVGNGVAPGGIWPIGTKCQNVLHFSVDGFPNYINTHNCNMWTLYQQSAFLRIPMRDRNSLYLYFYYRHRKIFIFIYCRIKASNVLCGILWAGGNCFTKWAKNAFRWKQLSKLFMLSKHEM